MLELRPRSSPDAEVRPIGPDRWRLEIPAGPVGRYRLAQLDDYQHLPRIAFPWQPPIRLRLQARVSGPDLPGTWGFGFWNDPFSASMGLGGVARRLPTLPNTAWFFYASPPNYLSLRDGHPAQGFLAATFASPVIPNLVLAPGLPFLLMPASASVLRRVARQFVREDAARLSVDPTAWHDYEINWRAESVQFAVDGAPAFATNVAPGANLGLVLWIDNQYAAFPPAGTLHFGALSSSEPAWLELAEMTVERG
jgi:hypothetical protein